MNKKKYLRLDSCPSVKDSSPPAPKNMPLVFASTSKAMACSSDLLSPCSDCSSEENNSPTALNSFKWDKPELGDKALEFSWTRRDNPQTVNERRPWSNGYVNLQTDCDDQEDEGGRSVVRGDDSSHCQPMKVDESLQKCAPVEKGLMCNKLIVDPRSFSPESQHHDLKDKRDEKGERLSNEPYLMSPSTPTENRKYIIAKLRQEEKRLEKVPWFQVGIPRDVALDVLAGQPVGSFIVRGSTTKPGCYALSLRVPLEKNASGIAHYLIMHTNKGYKIKGFTKEFETLDALITHHSVMPELLPCTLILPRDTKEQCFSRKDDDLDFVNSDQADRCSLFSDIHWIMNDLKL